MDSGQMGKTRRSYPSHSGEARGTRGALDRPLFVPIASRPEIVCTGDPARAGIVENVPGNS